MGIGTKEWHLRNGSCDRRPEKTQKKRRGERRGEKDGEEIEGKYTVGLVKTEFESVVHGREAAVSE